MVQATAAMAVLLINSHSIGVRIPRAECRRPRLWKISMYSKIALASSTRVFQPRVSSSSTCMRDQNASVPAKPGPAHWPSFRPRSVALSGCATGSRLIASRTRRWRRPVSTGSRWAILEDAFELTLCNARHVKPVPAARPTFPTRPGCVSSMEAGLLGASFVPPWRLRGASDSRCRSARRTRPRRRRSRA